MTLSKKTTIALALSLALTPLLPATAEIYKTVDKDGRTVFTDSPGGRKAEAIKLPEVNTQPATPIPVKIQPLRENLEETEAQDEENVESYTLEITSPANETTVTKGQLTLASSVIITPALREGHKIQFYIDNLPFGKASTSSSTTYDMLYRGTHTIHAAVVNQKKKILERTESVTIYVHRHSIIKSK